MFVGVDLVDILKVIINSFLIIGFGMVMNKVLNLFRYFIIIIINFFICIIC